MTKNKNLKQLQKEMDLLKKAYELSLKTSCDEVSCGECPFNLGNKKLSCPTVPGSESGCGEACVRAMIGEILKNCQHQ